MTTDQINEIRVHARRFVRELGFFRTVFGREQITPSQGHLLLEVGNQPGMSQDRLAAILNLEQSTASRNIKNLMSKGLLDEERDVMDARRKKLYLTKKGEEELHLYNQKATDNVTSAFRFLNQKERDTCVEGFKLYSLALLKANVLSGSHHELKTRFASESDVKDIEEITGMVNSVYRTAEDGLWIEGAQRTSSQEIEKDVRAGHIMLAKLDSTTVGAVKITRWDDDTAEFGQLVAHPDYKQIGVGRLLVDQAEQWARDEGCQQMRLELLTPKAWDHPEKEFLKSWYSRRGYEPQKTEPFEQMYPQLKPLLATACNFTPWLKTLN